LHKQNVRKVGDLWSKKLATGRLPWNGGPEQSNRNNVNIKGIKVVGPPPLDGDEIAWRPEGASSSWKKTDGSRGTGHQLTKKTKGNRRESGVCSISVRKSKTEGKNVRVGGERRKGPSLTI